jgi:hypothetical protein
MLGTAGRVSSQSYIGRINQELLDFDARTSLVLRVHQVICSFVSQLCPSWHHHKQLGTTFGQSTVFTSQHPQRAFLPMGMDRHLKRRE